MYLYKKTFHAVKLILDTLLQFPTMGNMEKVCEER